MHNEVGNFSKITTNFYRIVKTRRPTVNLYENIVTEDKFAILNFIEDITNPRIRESKGETSIIPSDYKFAGDNSSLVMAPFCDFSTDYPSRFSDGTFGVFYCAKELECAIEETKYHTLKFLSDTNETRYSSQRRVLLGQLSGKFYDIVNQNLPEIYSTIDYSQGQLLGKEQKENETDGVKFDSVRYKGGTCFAIFKPCVILSIKEIKCYNYTLVDGKIIVDEISCL